jgi:hypothetical protein
LPDVNAVFSFRASPCEPAENPKSDPAGRLKLTAEEEGLQEHLRDGLQGETGRSGTRFILSERKKDGEVAEWSNAPASKAGVPERVPGVRIPASPPILSAALFLALIPGNNLISRL